MMGIGEIRNWYGGLWVTQDGEKFFWAIESYYGHKWYEIPKELFDSLVRYEENRRIEESKANG